MLVNMLNDSETFSDLDGCWIADASDSLSIEEYEQLLSEDSDSIPCLGYWSVEKHNGKRRAVFYTFQNYKNDVYLRVGLNLISVADLEKLL